MTVNDDGGRRAFTRNAVRFQGLGLSPPLSRLNGINHMNAPLGGLREHDAQLQGIQACREFPGDAR